MAVFLNFKVIFMKLCKELNDFLLLHCSSGHSLIVDFFLKCYREEEGVSSDTVT